MQCSPTNMQPKFATAIANCQLQKFFDHVHAGLTTAEPAAGAIPGMVPVLFREFTETLRRLPRSASAAKITGRIAQILSSNSMRICAEIDRPSLNGRVCSQARLLVASTVRCHDKRPSRRQCSCSYSASTSEGSVEEFQFHSHHSGNITRCIHPAKRALKRAFERCQSRRFRDPAYSQAAANVGRSTPSRYSTCTGQHFFELAVVS